MILLSATSEYVIAGRSRKGFPILLNSDMSSCSEVNEFLRFYLLRAQIESKGSWEPISRSLYDYFGFLEAHGLSWKDVNRGETKNLLAAYRDYCFGTASLARNTVILRITYICEFYKYALRQGWLDTLPYQYERRHHVNRPPGFFAHLASSNNTALGISAVPRRHRSLIKFLSLEQARLLLRAATNVHHAAIIRTGLLTGMRRAELATFPAAYVFDPRKSKAVGNNVSVTLDPTDGSGMRTKGSKPRVIYIDREVMRGLYRYKSLYRGERSSLTSDQHSNLFLNKDGQPFTDCGKGIEAIVRNLGKSIGISAYPHILRHTYATHTLHALQLRSSSGKGIQPLVFLQRQLGHSSLNTTMEYFHLLDQIATDAALAYDEELSFWKED
ncbi:tyrosine recombinase XerC [Janthinobacterium sp. HH103]|uniref:tyrosine-type recombinase/integrase n=1 Tax=unclassified Janthinobacterium TaxID=2610881 RepID=UPI0008752B58|nr:MULTISPECIES: tyrosine-type recombinase/integrase [unclassified Janthinobacterium]OEZ65705.1 tyrosine recombinase XerC [Janthinobacterium sp. HH100]OEZ87801.1 tyrosine recombinase XerC [Janthinobacterium sp. HH103]QOU71557.1 Tyrosine recombinase XerC [Janthinobacterium sp. HH102]